MHRRVPRLVRHSVARQVEKNNPISCPRERCSERSVEIAVEQKPVQVDDNLRTGTVHLIGEANVAIRELPVCDRRDRCQAVRCLSRFLRLRRHNWREYRPQDVEIVRTCPVY